MEGFGDSEKTFEEWAISMMAKTPTKVSLLVSTALNNKRLMFF